MAIMTAAVYKARTRITAADAMVTAAIATAEQEIARELGYRTLDATTYTDEPHAGDGTPYLRLGVPGVSALTSIKIRSSGGGTSEVTEAAYRMAGDDARRGIVTLEGFAQGPYHDDSPFTAANRRYASGPGWPTGPGAVLVSCVGGYTDETDCPADLLGLITRVTSRMLNDKHAPGASANAGGVSVTLADEIKIHARGWSRGGEFASA